MHLNSGDEVVIVEGAVDGPAAPAPDVLPRLREQSLAKYKSWADDPEPVYVVRPRTAIAWRDLPKDAIRWRLGRSDRAAGEP